MPYTEHEQEAYDRGKEAAISAASWVLDGNAELDHYRRLLAMLEEGDPAVYDFYDFYDCLPRGPNLSDEYADDPTPRSLARDILGDDRPQCHGGGVFIDSSGYVECHCSDAAGSPVDHDQRVVDAISDAFEAGVSEHFTAECERLLHAALSD